MAKRFSREPRIVKGVGVVAWWRRHERQIRKKIQTIALLLFGGVKPEELQEWYGITEGEVKEAQELLTRADEMHAEAKARRLYRAAP